VIETPSRPSPEPVTAPPPPGRLPTFTLRARYPVNQFGMLSVTRNYKPDQPSS
jgi:hypothetical protein